jgi:hypothetical protein
MSTDILLSTLIKVTLTWIILLLNTVFFYKVNLFKQKRINFFEYIFDRGNFIGFIFCLNTIFLIISIIGALIYFGIPFINSILNSTVSWLMA